MIGSSFPAIAGVLVLGAIACLAFASLATVACFSPDNTEGVAPVTVSFENCSRNATVFLWDFGDGTMSTKTEPLHEYTKPGKYDVTLIAIGPLGTRRMTIDECIVVISEPPASKSEG